VLLAKEYASEALRWMVEDRVVTSADVGVEPSANGILISVVLNRPGRDPVSFRFDRVWDHQQEDI